MTVYYFALEMNLSTSKLQKVKKSRIQDIALFAFLSTSGGGGGGRSSRREGDGVVQHLLRHIFKTFCPLYNPFHGFRRVSSQ